MSKFTTEVRWICETYANSIVDTETASPTQIISAAAPSIFSFDFPIYDERYRLPLETKILRHYYTREIGEETVALWKLRLEDRLNMIMPYYNELYKSSLLQFNPFYDVDWTKEGRRNESGTKANDTTEHIVSNNSAERTENKTDEFASTTNANVNRESESNNTSLKVNSGEADGSYSEHNTKLFSDTPQGALEIFGIETSSQPTVQGNSWLTTAEMNDSNGTSHSENSETENITGEAEANENESSTTVKNDEGSTQIQGNETREGTSNRVQSDVGTISNMDEYIETVKGKMGTTSYSKLLLEFRETLINIDKMIIKELDDLFFGLWN